MARRASPEPEWPLLLFGLLFTAGGVLIVGGAALDPERVSFASESGSRTPPWLTAIFGLAFLFPGLWALGTHRLVPAALQKLSGALLPIGLPCALGAGIIGAALTGTEEADFPAGRWAAAAAGGLFFLAGVAVGFGQLPEGALRRVGGSILGLLLLTLFAVLVTGLALFGTEGAGVVAVDGIPVDAPSWLGRIVLGGLALLLDALAIGAWVHAVRSRFRG